MKIIKLAFYFLVSCFPCMVISKCPSEFEIYPCKCLDGGIINCNSTENYEIKNIFENIKKVMAESTPFESIHVENYNKYNIPEDVFDEILIKNIEFVDSNITSIDPNSFTATNLYTETLAIRHTRLSNEGTNERNIYDAISKMIHLKSLYLIDNMITTVPEHAFRKIIGTQTFLKWISLADSDIFHIGDNAFYELPALTKLELYNNKISKIGTQTFAFALYSNTTLEINLKSNLLDSTSFERNWYTRTRRPLRLNLANNKITFISESIFSAFLNRNPENSINVENNPILCDCKSKWLIEDIEFYKNKIIGMKCQDKKNIFDWNISEFNKCVDKADSFKK